MLKEIKIALNTPKDERTHKQEKLVYDVAWSMKKRHSHERNEGMFQGRRGTGTGLGYFRRGVKRA